MNTLAAVTAAFLGLLIKKGTPELGMALSLCTVVIILAAAVGASESLREVYGLVRTLTGSGSIYVAPVMKCLAISLITKTASELCKDASQAAAASAVELSGTLCAMGVATPMMLSMLKMIASLV